MPFTPRNWTDGSAPALSAANIEDLETRVTDYTDSETSGLIPRVVYNVADYGAVGDGIVRTASMTNGSGTLTIATESFTAGDVGKSVLVNGAGAAGADLFTTIAGYTDGYHVTLTANASTTVTDKAAFYGTDDTGAIQDAMDAATNAGGGVVYFPCAPLATTGRYVVAGSLQTHASVDPGGTDPAYLAQLTLPTGMVGGKGYLEFLGDRPMQGFEYPDKLELADATYIVSLSAGQTYTTAIPSLLAGPDPQTAIMFNVHIRLRDIGFVAPRNPKLCAVQLSQMANLSLQNVSFSTLDGHNTWATEPTNPCGIGLYSPANFVYSNVDILGLTVQGGFYTGFIWGEHANVDSTFIQRCKIAASPPPVNLHGARFGLLDVSACTYGIAYNDWAGAGLANVPAQANNRVITVQHMEVETEGSGWAAKVNCLHDPTDRLYGFLNHNVISAGGGGWAQNSAANITVTDLAA